MENGIALFAPDRIPASPRTTIRCRIALACLAAALGAIGGCERAAIPLPSPQASAVRDAGSIEERRREDPVRHRVWVLNSDGVFVHHTTTPGNLVEVTLPSWQWADTPYGSLPDLALGPDGEAVVTSNVVPVLWRIDPETLAVSRHGSALDADQDKDIGFSSLTYSVEHDAFFAVSDAQGSLWQIDRLLRTGRKIPRPASTDTAFTDRVNAATRCIQGISPKLCMVRTGAACQRPSGYSKGTQS